MSNQGFAVRTVLWQSAACWLLGLLCAGCAASQAEDANPEAEAAQPAGITAESKPANSPAAKTAAQVGKAVSLSEDSAAELLKESPEQQRLVQQAAATPQAKLWAQQVAKVDALLKADKYSEAEQALRELDQIYSVAELPTEVNLDFELVPARSGDKSSTLPKTVGGPSVKEFAQLADLQDRLEAGRKRNAAPQDLEELQQALAALKTPQQEVSQPGASKASVRFIRLQYEGGDWDQDFGVGGDMNMLIEYGIRTKHRVAKQSESRTVSQLSNFPLGQSPPLFYLTGQGNIKLSDSDIKDLREYLLDKHGMLFGDNGGSQHFHSQFIAMMGKILPAVRPVPVPLDDTIHRIPYAVPLLPYVAPHGGKEALGWKVDGRWVCYYHPGDIGDAWADGHAGVEKQIAEFSYQLGTNVIFYANSEYAKWLASREEKPAEAEAEKGPDLNRLLK